MEAIDLPVEGDVAPAEMVRDGVLIHFLSLRAAESVHLGETNQDALSLRTGNGRIAFALCDGVGQSFRGELAAGAVARALAERLAVIEHWNESYLAAACENELAALIAPVSAAVMAVALPSDLPEILRDVLEEKRRSGSETMLLAGVVDPVADRIGLVWCGDSGLSFERNGASSFVIAPSGSKRPDRWSSRRGLTGPLRAYSGSLAGAWRLSAYSDGFLAAPEGTDWEDIRSWNALERLDDDRTVLLMKTINN